MRIYKPMLCYDKWAINLWWRIGDVTHSFAIGWYPNGKWMDFHTRH